MDLRHQLNRAASSTMVRRGNHVQLPIWEQSLYAISRHIAAQKIEFWIHFIKGVPELPDTFVVCAQPLGVSAYDCPYINDQVLLLLSIMGRRQSMSHYLYGQLRYMGLPYSPWWESNPRFQHVLSSSNQILRRTGDARRTKVGDFLMCSIMIIL